MIGDRVKHAIRAVLITNCESSKKKKKKKEEHYGGGWNMWSKRRPVPPSDVVPLTSDCSAMRSFGQRLMDQWETEYKLFFSRIRDIRSLN